MSFDAFVFLALPELKQHLSEGNSHSLRELRAYLGLGSGGTKEENRSIIYDHLKRQRQLQAGLHPHVAPRVSDSVSIAVVSDPLIKSNPWKGKKEKDKPNSDIAKDRKNDIKKPMLEKSIGNLDRVRKLAECPSADSVMPEPVQPCWATQFVSSPHLTSARFRKRLITSKEIYNQLNLQTFQKGTSAAFLRNGHDIRCQVYASPRQFAAAPDRVGSH